MMRGNPASLREFGKRLRALPIKTAQAVATRVAPTLSDATRAAYSSSADVYGAARVPSVSGAPLTLVRSGATQASLRFVSIGTQVRCSLGTPYAKYLIGKYRILPNGPLPTAWGAQIASTAQSVISEGLSS